MARGAWSVKWSSSALCWFSLASKNWKVSPTQTQGQIKHGTQYTRPEFRKEEFCLQSEKKNVVEECCIVLESNKHFGVDFLQHVLHDQTALAYLHKGGYKFSLDSTIIMVFGFGLLITLQKRIWITIIFKKNFKLVSVSVELRILNFAPFFSQISGSVYFYMK